MNRERKFILITLLLIFLAGAGYYIYTLVRPNPAADAPHTLYVPKDGVTQAGQYEYRNEQYKFSLLYPPELEVREFKENGGGFSVTFQDKSAKGFQIFVIPYDKPQITKERFLLDEPSGVRENPVDVVVGGVTASMFFGQNSIMGDTREVWFIKDGLLYEVATYKELDEWLGTIMQTWKFI